MTEVAALRLLPGPRGIPMLGRGGSMFRFFREPIGMLRHLHATYGSVAAVTAGDPGLVCVFGPELNQQVLSAPDLYENNVELPIKVPPGTALERLAKILASMNGVEHRRLRKTMGPLFSRRALESHRLGVISATEGALARWVPDREIDLTAATAEIAISISFRCLFDMDVLNEANELAKMALAFVGGAFSLKLVLMPFDAPGMPYRHFLQLCDRIETRLRALIDERRPNAASRSDSLSILMTVEDDEGKKLPESMLIGLANEQFIAGHETMARTLAWTFLLLERHPQVLSDLVDELSGQLGGEAPTLEQLDKLPLLDAVFKESMRLLSPTPFVFFRRTTGSVQVGPYELPKGSSVVVSPLITHHMPELWPEPNRFKPERWLGTQKPGTYAYLPFNAGPRTCVGISFAMMAMKTAAAMVLQRFRFASPPGAEVSYKARATILGSKDSIRMQLERQDRSLRGPLNPVRGTVHELVDLPN